MANEQRLIKVKELTRAIWKADCDVYEFCEGCVTNMGISRLKLDDVIDEVPTVDAVEVVRCKDCKHCRVRYPEKQIGKEATQGWYCKEHKSYRRPDDFCSYGERREGE